jgi:hypothetical protein
MRIGVCVLGVAFASGCAIGGGPVVGFGQRGWYGGAEVGGGIEYAELAVGGTFLGARRLHYVRLDFGVDGAAAGDVATTTQLGSWRGSLGGMLGVGAAFESGRVHDAFVVAPSYSFQHVSSCTHQWYSVVGASLSLRYDGAWSVAFAPRISAAATPCDRT